MRKRCAGSTPAARTTRSDGARTAEGAVCNLIAFVRGGRVITVAPRFWTALKATGKKTVLRLPDGRWQDAFTGDEFSGEVLASDLFGKFPSALLVRKEAA